MRVLLTVSALAVALAAAPAAATPAGRFASPPVIPHGPSARHAFWRDHGGDHNFWRRRQAFGAAIGGFVDEAAEPEEAPPPLFFSAPFFVDAALAPGAGPAPVERAPGPKLIEIGQSAPSRRPLPLVIYGD